jgi:hypothetical protein
VPSYIVVPTSHLPRTEGKIDVMAERASHKVPLFHPHDAGMDMDYPADAQGGLNHGGFTSVLDHNMKLFLQRRDDLSHESP